MCSHDNSFHRHYDRARVEFITDSRHLPSHLRGPPWRRADDPRLITPAAQAAILADLKTPAAGSKDADVTIVEWFDYDCPFCRTTHPHLQDALRTDPNLRIVYKEWPVFGEVSEYAAQSALAANWQGRYLQAHDALISTPDAIADRAHVDSTLRVAGIDMARLSRDREAHAREIAAILARSVTEATQLGGVVNGLERTRFARFGFAGTRTSSSECDPFILALTTP